MLQLMYTNQRFDQESYDKEDKIVNELLLVNHKFSANTPSYVDMKLHKKVVEDETSWWNLKLPEEEECISATPGQVQLSSIQNLSEHYKQKRYSFMQVRTFMSSDKVLISRETIDLFDLLGEIGGVLSIIVYIGQFFCFKFAQYKIKAIITKNLYRDTKSLDKRIVSPTSSNNFLNRVILFCCPCCRTKFFRDWGKLTRGVRNSFQYDLDLVNYIRRFRMHGIALTYMMDEQDKVNTGELGYTRSVHCVNKEYDL